MEEKKMKRKTRFLFQILVLCLISVMMLQACGTKKDVEYDKYKVYVSSEQEMDDDYKLNADDFNYISYYYENENKVKFKDKIQYELPWGTVDATKISDSEWESCHGKGEYILDNGDKLIIKSDGTLSSFNARRLLKEKDKLLSWDVELNDTEIINKAREYVVQFFGEEIASLYLEVPEKLEWFSDDNFDKGDTIFFFRMRTEGILWSSKIMVQLYQDGTLLYISNANAESMIGFDPEPNFEKKVENAISDWIANNEIKYEIRDKLIVPIGESRFAVKVNIYITESNQRRDIWIYVPIQG